ncbi:hypothetical protein K3495_g4916 [Podosphaera aphanis]|nr:hypothetical protein K3495_g4916 [Podosphaera aphanis]
MSPGEIEAYESLYHHAVGIHIQVVGANVLRQIIDLKDPHAMWVHLKTEYKRGSTLALVYQLASILKSGKLIQDSSIIPDCPRDFHCETCALSKSHHNKPKPPLSRAKERGEYTHSDLCGPLPIPSIGNALYYISFVDDATRYFKVQFLKNKSDAASAIIGFITELETQYGCSTKAFRSDNGGEYVNKDLTQFFAQKGIVHDLIPPYSPESNGLAETLNRSIGEAVRAMLLPKKENGLWAEAARTYIHTKNRLTHGAVNGQTPYEAFYGKKPSIMNFQSFGRECYVHIPSAKRPAGSKLPQRAEKGLFVGYTKVPQQYRIYVPEKRKICVSADVEFKPFSASKTETEPPSIKTTLVTWRNGLGIDKSTNLPQLQGSQHESEISPQQQLNKNSQELEPGFYTTQSEELEAQIAGFFRDPIPIRNFLEPDEEIIVEEDSDIFEAIVNRYSIIDGDGDDNDCDDKFEEIRPSISEANKALDTLQSFIFLGKNGGKISVFKAFNQIGNEISQERRDRFTQSSIDNWLVRS